MVTVGLIVVVAVAVVTVKAGVMMTNFEGELVHALGSLSVSSNHRKLISEATEPKVHSSSVYKGSGRLGGRP